MEAQKLHDYISRTDEIIEDTRHEQEMTDKVFAQLIAEQDWMDADEADQILEQEVIRHGFY